MKKVIIICIIISFRMFGLAQSANDIVLHAVPDTATFSIPKAKGKYVALHFLLKTECPFCIRHTNEYAQKAASLPNVLQIFIKPDETEEIKQWLSKLAASPSLPFPLYQDRDTKLADYFHIPSGYAFHGQLVHCPALILLDKKGNEIFRYVGKNNTDRYSFDNLANKIKEYENAKQF